jgi:hypothetical protein
MMITGLNRPLGPQEVEAPRISKQSAHESGKAISPTPRPPLPPPPPEKFPGTHFCYTLNLCQDHSATERIFKIYCPALFHKSAMSLSIRKFMLQPCCRKLKPRRVITSSGINTTQNVARLRKLVHKLKWCEHRQNSDLTNLRFSLRAESKLKTKGLDMICCYYSLPWIRIMTVSFKQ